MKPVGLRARLWRSIQEFVELELDPKEASQRFVETVRRPLGDGLR